MVLLIMALLAQAPASAAPPTGSSLLIWGGGVKREDAERDLQEVQRVVEPLKGVLTLAAGYPRLLESKTISGLKPGFWIVALGACPDPAQPLALFRAIRGGVYERNVQLGNTDPSGCPVVGNGWDWPAPVQVKIRSRTLVVLPFVYQLTEEGDFAREYNKGLAVGFLVDAAGHVLDTRATPSSSDYSTLGPIAVEASGVALGESYVDEPCTGLDAHTFLTMKRTLRFEVAGDGVAIKEQSKKILKKEKCDDSERRLLEEGFRRNDENPQND
jgi:hypothetical protein